jgi:glycosyltransferase involved in cell wall biosynthesis
MMDSLIEQTIGFENLQIILADDCSTDESSKVIDEYAARYANVITIHLSENSGAAGIPRNKAMEYAAAEYIMFLDSDDSYYPAACSDLYSAIKESQADLVSGYYAEGDEQGNITTDRTHNYRQIEERTYNLPEYLYIALSISNTFTSKIYKKQLIELNNITFLPHIPGQDFVFYCNYVLVSKNMIYINKPIVIYTLRNSDNPSISFSGTKKYFLGINQVYKYLYDVFKKYNQVEAYNIKISEVLDFYINKMIDVDLSDDSLNDIFTEWRWLFEYYRDKKIVFNAEYAKIISYSIINGRLSESIEIYRELKKLRKYVHDLEDAKQFFCSQKNYLEKSNQILRSQNTNQQELIDKYSYYFNLPISKRISLSVKELFEHLIKRKNINDMGL